MNSMLMCMIALAIGFLGLALAAAADAPQSRPTTTSASAPTTQQALEKDAIQKRILQYRTAEVVLTVTGADGKPLANQPVRIKQVKHKFLFGCNAFRIGVCKTPEDEAAYRKRFADLLNYATLPFYWAGYEPQEGQTNAKRLHEMARWCKDNGIITKGHPLCWHEGPVKWLEGRSAEEIEAAQVGRIKREIKEFAGEIDRWDVANEAVVMPTRDPASMPVARLCRKIGPVKLIKETFDAARQTSPKAMLVLNDFNTSSAFEDLIQKSFEAKAPIDVIGIQSHMHRGYWPTDKTWDVLERFSKFGKPLHLTELTILSGPLKPKAKAEDFSTRTDWDSTPEGEELQARQVEEFYTIAFSHPAVEAITWWDLSDQNSWQGAPAGLVRKDMSPKPAYDVLMKLVKHDWWTGPLELKTDANGQVEFRGFLGDYRCTAAEQAGEFSLPKSGAAEATVAIKK